MGILQQGQACSQHVLMAASWTWDLIQHSVGTLNSIPAISKMGCTKLSFGIQEETIKTSILFTFVIFQNDYFCVHFILLVIVVGCVGCGF